ASMAGIRAGIKDIFAFDNNAEAIEGLERILEEGDFVLVKGSRAARMEEIVEAIKGLDEKR
ncbi:MAG: UDP-N-acetylmuramoylalanyl-D-glutamate--2,6-diaminopimelate ligase, partial [Deltaproteobacteria bacterium]|nr:UDP-N-acetylmuramoylalanyl-D-glutamate--2,6-diaminopimelate ligase [Deltaproteobacteria bacterium]